MDRKLARPLAPNDSSIVIFGGSFDPPHVGHIAVCDWVVAHHHFDHLLIIPCGSHPFDKTLTPFSHRLQMLSLAFPNALHDPNTLVKSDTQGSREKNSIIISHIEANLAPKSYTIDTVEKLSNTYPLANFWLLCGSDIKSEVHSWHRSKELLERVQLLSYPMKRIVGISSDSTKKFAENQTDIAYISSTDIRNRIKHQKEIKDIVPSAVADYIRTHRLYVNTIADKTP